MSQSTDPFTLTEDALWRCLEMSPPVMRVVRVRNRIRMSAADAPVLRQILSRVALPERVELVPDPGLECGSVILETTRGILDSSITTQLEEIERGFVDMVKRPS